MATTSHRVVCLPWECAKRQKWWHHRHSILILCLEDIASYLCSNWPGNWYFLLLEVNSCENRPVFSARKGGFNVWSLQAIICTLESLIPKQVEFISIGRQPFWQYFFYLILYFYLFSLSQQRNYNLIDPSHSQMVFSNIFYIENFRGKWSRKF